jgi:hypothetical protein
MLTTSFAKHLARELGATFLRGFFLPGNFFFPTISLFNVLGNAGPEIDDKSGIQKLLRHLGLPCRKPQHRYDKFH